MVGLGTRGLPEQPRYLCHVQARFCPLGSPIAACWIRSSTGREDNPEGLNLMAPSLIAQREGNCQLPLDPRLPDGSFFRRAELPSATMFHAVNFSGCYQFPTYFSRDNRTGTEPPLRRATPCASLDGTSETPFRAGETSAIRTETTATGGLPIPPANGDSATSLDERPGLPRSSRGSGCTDRGTV